MKFARTYGVALILGILLINLFALLPAVDGFKRLKTDDVAVFRPLHSITLDEEQIPELVLLLPEAEQIGHVVWQGGTLFIDYYLQGLSTSELGYAILSQALATVYAATNNVERLYLRLYLRTPQYDTLLLAYGAERATVEQQALRAEQLELAKEEYLRLVGQLDETILWKSWYNTKK